MSTPSVVFVPGSFAPASLYHPLAEAVVARGVEAQAINLPTVHLPGEDRIAPSLYDDGDFIASTIEKLADEGKDVIVIGHSYGGIPLSQGTVGLSKPTRAAQGKPGGLVTVAYMTAYVPVLNESAADIQAGGDFKLDVTLDVSTLPAFSPYLETDQR
jgi:pimeloyl-ACP methyl ester carboxylesterase